MERSDIETTCIFNDFIAFKTTCECGCSSLKVIVETNRELKNDIMCSLFYDMHWNDRALAHPYTGFIGFLKRIKYRIVAAFNVLFNGWLETEGEFIFRDKEHLEAFINILNKSKEEIELELQAQNKLKEKDS